MTWRTKPIILEMESVPVTLKCSSLRQFQLFLTLAVLLLFSVGWLLGSGLEALNQTFKPSEQLQQQRLLLDFQTVPKWKQESLNLNMEPSRAVSNDGSSGTILKKSNGGLIVTKVTATGGEPKTSGGGEKNE